MLRRLASIDLLDYSMMWWLLHLLQFVASLSRLVDVAPVQRTLVAAGVTQRLVELKLVDVR